MMRNWIVELTILFFTGCFGMVLHQLGASAPSVRWRWWLLTFAIGGAGFAIAYYLRHTRALQVAIPLMALCFLGYFLSEWRQTESRLFGRAEGAPLLTFTYGIVDASATKAEVQLVEVPVSFPVTFPTPVSAGTQWMMHVSSGVAVQGLYDRDDEHVNRLAAWRWHADTRMWTSPILLPQSHTGDFTVSLIKQTAEPEPTL